MKAATVFSLVCLAAGTAAAQQEEELKKSLAGCARLELDTARLDCFEQLALAVARIPPEPEKPRVSKFNGLEPGRWRVETATDPVDDSRTVALATVDSSERMQLVLACRAAKPLVQVNADVYVGDNDVRVVTRLDEEKAELKKWSATGNRRTAALTGGAAGQLISRMVSAKRLVVQVHSPIESAITAIFSLDGFGDLIAPLKEACPIP
jgi:hypothetical protein